MTTITHRTPPAPIRAHLHRTSRTTCHHADARIAEAFYPSLGWVRCPSQPFPSPGAIRQLQRQGATQISVAYNRPYGGGRPQADFTVRECVGVAA